jgi:hypothetical protein
VQPCLVSVSSRIILLLLSCILIGVEFTTQFVEQEKIVGNNDILKQSAKEAYKSYILAYNSHSMKDIFNVHGLDLKVKCFLMALSGFVGFCARLILIHSINCFCLALHSRFIVNLLCERIFVYSALQCVPYIFSLFCTKKTRFIVWLEFETSQKSKKCPYV